MTATAAGEEELAILGANSLPSLSFLGVFLLERASKVSLIICLLLERVTVNKEMDTVTVTVNKHLLLQNMYLAQPESYYEKH